jgi:hypothetical protein
VLPASVSQDWKVITRYKYSSLFGSSSAMKKKSFITLTPGENVIKHFSPSSPMLRTNKLERMLNISSQEPT